MTDTTAQQQTFAVEFCVMHPSFPDEPHRGPMSLEAALEWVRETEDEDGVRRGAFYIACRMSTPWTRITGEPSDD